MKNEVIKIPENLTMFVDKRTGAHSVGFPIDFPSGHGTIILCRLKKMRWDPSQEIESITITYKNENTTA